MYKHNSRRCMNVSNETTDHDRGEEVQSQVGRLVGNLYRMGAFSDNL